MSDCFVYFALANMIATTTAYISIGSNQGKRLANLQNAILHFNMDGTEVIATSHVYENAAMGFDGADFLNACFCIRTDKSPTELLKHITATEAYFGRKRFTDGQYHSRTVDLDILYYGADCISTDTLTIPHPRMTQRNFVLKPLADIAPQFYHPLEQKDTRNLLQQCQDTSVLCKRKYRLFVSRVALFKQLQFLAIEGTIGAGKTTLAKMISKDFNAKLVLERFADNAFLPKFYEDPERYAFPLEMSFLADRYQQFTDDTSQFDLFKNFMVSDYDIFKSLIFAKVTLQNEEFGLYRKLFNFMYKEVKKPDIYVYLHQNTDRLLENIKKRGRDYEQNISRDYLEKINRGYLNFIKSHPQQTSLLIDLGNLDFVSNPADYRSILEKIGAALMDVLN
ncbi:2-amino-4-hydroxy-6-hydroxymethyldihydropteridine pyrophosphokinase [Croceitalea dokdonensis DOKDO 023]|uniref:2-amino-4-hydroxy-6-hydroxymethyldihydropteridine pyrophosphokinase n=1 Tax=Croceitalea dokdonensis DOKDO 023 TaxID=1300341 RepID=A0A0P7AGA3_9FLAO|nr:2-amino-4-hydroxy-6-hydroxymethyldihydropteridine diphosphokinase [Croceitalea dokdonensis]KPM32480.1 2-amino-4-hydroxy-6-hydroxymethyldihydropteridine pyrophosphokinase [Croceitalea dokdonensis DOKDO 023]